MPCCSAYDSLNAPLATPLATDPTTTTALAGDPATATAPAPDALSAGTTADTAATGTDAAAAGAVPPGFDCRNDACFEFAAGRGACPKGICKRDERGNPAADHARPRCPVHDRPRPFGVGPK